MHAGPSIPLAELLQHGSSALPAANHTRSSKSESTLGVHNYANRLLDRVVTTAGVDRDLSSTLFGAVERSMRTATRS